MRAGRSRGQMVRISGFRRRSEFRSGEEVIEGYVEESGHLNEDINTGYAAALLVHTDGAGAEMEFFGQLNLIQPDVFAKVDNLTG